MRTLKSLRHRPHYLILFGLAFACLGTALIILTKAATANADFNNDGTVNITDLSILATNYNKSGQVQTQGDANGDGLVNITDLSVLATQWNTNPNGGGGTTTYTIPVSGTISASSLMSQINAKTGPVSVGPASGQTSFTISGGIALTRANVTFDHANMPSGIEFLPGSNGSAITNSTVEGFNIFGADDITLKGNTFDGNCSVNNNQIWDRPAGSTPDRYRIQNNTFRNFCNSSDASAHTEALYIGYSTNGLIEGNTFTHNGTTSHIFFTWWGETANSSTSYPRNICVRNNQFGPTAGAYYSFNFRAEIPLSSNIAHESNNVSLPGAAAFTTSPSFTRACISPISS